MEQSSGKPAVVAIARLAGDETARSRESVYEVTRRVLSHLGGMGQFVRPGQTVFIKPNQTMFQLAEKGVTTDPWVVAAIVRLVHEAGGRALVGDMPGAGLSAAEVMDITGVADAVRDAGGELAQLDKDPQRTLPVPNGKVVPEIELPASIADADVRVNAPKAKTHFVDPISGAVKNWMGAMRPDVRMRHHDIETPQYVVDAMTACPPQLHIMDALWVGQGNGPIGTVGAWIGCVLAGTDPAALDVITARILGFSEEKATSMTYAGEAARRGLGTIDPRQIAVLGEDPSTFRTEIIPTALGTFGYLAPVRVIVGEDVSLPGTIGHFKSVADMWHRDHVWDLIRLYRRGTPTIMIGRAEDPDFDRHLEEGPYVTIDDVVDDRYKRHPRVQHIAGHPVCDQMFKELTRALGVEVPGNTAMALIKAFTKLQAEFEY